jgi:hypothetical protein
MHNSIPIRMPLNRHLQNLQSMGLSQFKDPSLNRLPALLRSAVKAGWYEGSVFFIITGTFSPLYIFTFDINIL